MRVIALVLTGLLAVCVADGQALAAKRNSVSQTVNPDRQDYQSAVTCGGGAACYRSGSKKQHKSK